MALENWRDLLQGCGDPELAVAIVRSIEALWRDDRHSLVVDASERHRAAELAVQIRAQWLLAPDDNPWNVHVEYNRKGVKVKSVNGGQQVVIPGKPAPFPGSRPRFENNRAPAIAAAPAQRTPGVRERRCAKAQGRIGLRNR